MRSQDERDLRTVLHEEAERHHPDRTSMLNRIARGRSAPAPSVLGRLMRSTLVAMLPRPVAAAAAVAAVLVVAVAGIQVANRSPQPSNPAAATASPSASPTPTAAPPPRTGPTSSSPSGHPSSGHSTSSLGPATTLTSPAPATVSDSYLGATAVLDPHSTPTWSQVNVTLTTTATLTALTVVVRIARTDGEADGGHWSTIPAELATSTVAVQNTVIVYRFTLNEGATLAPGSYVFAMQYTHAAGRALTADTFQATAYAARASSPSASPTAVAPTGSDRKAQVNGGFTG